MKRPEHPRIRPLTVKAVLAQSPRAMALSVEAGAGDVFTAPEQRVHDCLALMESKAVERIAVVDNGKLVGELTVAQLQKALITHYEAIFTAIELDQKILFLQGTYSC